MLMLIPNYEYTCTTNKMHAATNRRFKDPDPMPNVPHVAYEDVNHEICALQKSIKTLMAQAEEQRLNVETLRNIQRRRDCVDALVTPTCPKEVIMPYAERLTYVREEDYANTCDCIYLREKLWYGDIHICDQGEYGQPKWLGKDGSYEYEIIVSIINECNALGFSFADLVNSYAGESMADEIYRIERRLREGRSPSCQTPMPGF